MNDDLQKRIAEAMRNPQNVGELANADAVGTVGNSDCGEMLRMWVKFKDENGKKVFVSEKGKAKEVKVETSTRTEKNVVVTSGIKAGDTVLTSGVMALKAGAPVKVSIAK